MNGWAPNNSLSLRVQSAITSISFPRSLERLRAMGTKWHKTLGRDWITDLDVLLSFPTGSDVVWIAPKWLSSGDILFFYHTKSAKTIARKLYSEARSLLFSSKISPQSMSTNELKMLVEILEREINLAEIYSGTIFGFAVVSGKPLRMFDEDKHFKGTIYAPLAEVVIFKKPLPAESFNDIVEIGQNTTTPVYSEQFTRLKDKLGENNILPRILQQAIPTSAGFRDINKDNWIEISCRKDARFVNEAQLRAYHADYLLDEIKDVRTPIYIESDCYRNGQRIGIADFFMILDNKFVPVEAKVNVLVEQDILFQIAKYIHIDSFIPTKGTSAGKTFKVPDLPFCLVIDQQGLYLIKDDKFINCSPDKPLFKREELNRSMMPNIRAFLAGC